MLDDLRIGSYRVDAQRQRIGARSLGLVIRDANSEDLTPSPPPDYGILPPHVLARSGSRPIALWRALLGVHSVPLRGTGQAGRLSLPCLPAAMNRGRYGRMLCLRRSPYAVISSSPHHLISAPAAPRWAGVLPLRLRMPSLSRSWGLRPKAGGSAAATVNAGFRCGGRGRPPHRACPCRP